MKKRGFTLVELLVTTSIIAVLATMGIASYNFVRVKARDTKRVADIRTIRSAIELYYETHSEYPTEKDGIILGTDQAQSISDAGITPRGGEKGNLYLENVPANILPGGIPYLYTSLNADGSACAIACQAYEVTFSLESAIGQYAAGPHKMTDRGLIGPESGYNTNFQPPSGLASYVPSAEDISFAFGSAKDVAVLVNRRLAAQPVQRANTMVLTPLAALAVAVNFIATAASALPLANFGSFMVFLFSQPFLLFGRRKRASWGTVYDAGTKVPIDLASVRLIDSRTNRPVATKVTDKNGRYAFSARPGTYRIEVSKPGFVFPAVSLSAVNDDGRYRDIYHGTLLRVEQAGQAVTVNVPMDPAHEPPAETRALLSIENKKQLRKALAMSGPVLGAVALIVTPSPLMLGLFAAHLVFYFIFKRLAEPPAPKNQGVVYDEEDKDPVDKAVVRIFSLPYNKVLEARVTDSQGRYNFYVGHGKYYLTVTKPGYKKTETDPIDFTEAERPTFIASDLPMRREAVVKAPRWPSTPGKNPS